MRKLFLFFSLLILLSSCKEYRYIEVPKVSIEKVLTRDTLLQRDSVIILQEHKGDTIKLVERYYKYIIDKGYKDSVRVDTITKIKEVIKTEVEYKQNTLQRILTWLGIIFLVVIIIKIIKKYEDNNS